jgi:hypothetical protein
MSVGKRETLYKKKNCYENVKRKSENDRNGQMVRW